MTNKLTLPDGTELIEITEEDFFKIGNSKVFYLHSSGLIDKKIYFKKAEKPEKCEKCGQEIKWQK